MTDKREITVTLEWRKDAGTSRMELFAGRRVYGQVWKGSGASAKEWFGVLLCIGSACLMRAPTKAEAMAAVEAAVIEALGGRDE